MAVFEHENGSQGKKKGALFRHADSPIGRNGLLTGVRHDGTTGGKDAASSLFEILIQVLQ